MGVSLGVWAQSRHMRQAVHGPAVSPQFPGLLYGLASALEVGVHIAPWARLKLQALWLAGRWPLNPWGMAHSGTQGAGHHASHLIRRRLHAQSTARVHLLPSAPHFVPTAPSWDGCDTVSPERNISCS